MISKVFIQIWSNKGSLHHHHHPTITITLKDTVGRKIQCFFFFVKYNEYN